MLSLSTAAPKGFHNDGFQFAFHISQLPSDVNDCDGAGEEGRQSKAYQEQLNWLLNRGRGVQGKGRETHIEDNLLCGWLVNAIMQKVFQHLKR